MLGAKAFLATAVIVTALGLAGCGSDDMDPAPRNSSATAVVTAPDRDNMAGVPEVCRVGAQTVLDATGINLPGDEHRLILTGQACHVSFYENDKEYWEAYVMSDGIADCANTSEPPVVTDRMTGEVHRTTVLDGGLLRTSVGTVQGTVEYSAEACVPNGMAYSLHITLPAGDTRWSENQSRQVATAVHAFLKKA